MIADKPDHCNKKQFDDFEMEIPGAPGLSVELDSKLAITCGKIEINNYMEVKHNENR